MRAVLIVGILIVIAVNGQRTKDKMFNPVNGASCFRRLNATHQTGCSSNFRGSVGVLHLVQSMQDIDFLTDKPPAPPYAPIIPPRLFTREVLLRLKAHSPSLISAVVLINNFTDVTSFSHETKCPNQISNLYPNTCDAAKPETVWNPMGTGLLHEDFPFPIYFVIDEAEIAKIVSCFEKFNNFDIAKQMDRSLCSIQVSTFMSAAVSSKVCIRRQNTAKNLSQVNFCDALQGDNVYATLFPRKQTLSSADTKDLILVTARLDTTSMFDGYAIGAMDSLVSYTVLMTTAHLLASLLPTQADTKQPNVLFMFFNGESYDYIGSQRFVYDLTRGNFPKGDENATAINVDDVKLMVDLGTLDTMNEIKFHRLSEHDTSNRLLALVQKYNTQFGLGVDVSDAQSQNLPSASAHTFLKANLTFPAVILNGRPTNKFYHSIYDDEHNIDFTYGNTSTDYTQLDKLDSPNSHFRANSIQMAVRNVSSMLGLALYEIITNQAYSGNNGASIVLADEIFYCFLVTSNCNLFRSLLPPNTTLKLTYPPQRYISAYQSGASPATAWTTNMFRLLIGQRLPNETEATCKSLPYAWFSGYNGTGECHLSTQGLSPALSPAFLDDNYDWSSGKYSTWTESFWSGLSARIFLKPSRTHESLTVAVGIVVTVLAFVIVFFISTKSDILFGNSTSSEIITVPARC